MPTATGRSVLSRPWIAPLAVLTVAFLAYSLPPYLTFDPARSRVPVPEDVAYYYPALVTHILFGSVALLTAVLQLWPWLRRTRPAVHRWSGRAYVFAGAIPAGLATLLVAPLGDWGPNQQVANTTLGVLWLLTTVIGYRRARQRRFAEHREWMIRSFALAFSIVANRAWGAVCIMVFAPDGPADPAAMGQAIGLACWLSLVTNLGLAELWLYRSRARQRIARRTRPATEQRRSVPA